MSEPGTMLGTEAQAPADLLHLALPQSQKVVLVIDLVESVRLMAADEAGTVQRWHEFVRHAQAVIIPAHHGRLVKSLGDGLMIEFEKPRDAVNTALALHGALNGGNSEGPADMRMQLRAGVNSSRVYSAEHDIYGAGVNLAARLTTLAGPGETVVSASVRDELTDGLDANIEDLGECYLKHIDKSVRTYRVGSAGSRSEVMPQREYVESLQPTIAVIPFETRSNAPEYFAVGEIIADGLISLLGGIREFKVISRLSTTAFRGRQASVGVVEAHLGANYVLSGSYVTSGKSILVTAELAAARNNQVVWVERMRGNVADLLVEHSELIAKIGGAVQKTLLRVEVNRAGNQPLPTVESFSLLLAGINLTHRQSLSGFMEAERVLTHLIERHPRSITPRAWLAKWHVLRVAQGWTQEPEKEAQKAKSVLAFALDREPEHSLALAVDGLVHAYIDKDFGVAMYRYDAAIRSNPNESLALLFRSAVHAYQENAEASVTDISRALSLSPLDPLQYYYDNFAMTAWLAAENYEQAILFGKRSLRANRQHGSTLRILTIAYSLAGQQDLAAALGREIRAQEPDFSIRKFLQRHPGRLASYFHRYVQALREAGLPD